MSHAFEIVQGTAWYSMLTAFWVTAIVAFLASMRWAVNHHHLIIAMAVAVAASVTVTSFAMANGDA